MSQLTRSPYSLQRRAEIAALAVVLCLVAWTALAQSPGGLMRDRVLETTLANGLKIITLEDHKAPLVTFQVWYRVGSRNESWGKTGLSHLLEHMMFKGTATVGGEEFSRLIEETGGEYNAFTSHDYTAYFETLSADHLQIAIDLEADRMRNLVLKEEDFKTELAVVMEERRLRTDDNPRAVLLEQVEATAYQVHPYHWPVIGWMGDLERLTLEDAKQYYDTYYLPCNAFIVVVGDFKTADVLERIKAAFGDHPAGQPPDQRKSAEPPQLGERRIWVKKEAQLATVVMAYHVPNLKSSDGYALEVAEAVLSAGESSRLYRNLVRGEKLALSADADYSLTSRDPGTFNLSVDVLPGKEVAEVEAALGRDMEELCTKPIPAPELQKAKNQLEAGFIFGQDSAFYRAMLLAQFEIASSWRDVDDYLASVTRVEASHIQSAACRYLTPENRTTGILVPLALREGKPLPAEPPTKERVIR